MSIKKASEVQMKSQIILTINTNILTIIFCYSVGRQTFWLIVRLLLKMPFISVFYLLNVLVVITSLDYSSSQPINDRRNGIQYVINVLTQIDENLSNFE